MGSEDLSSAMSVHEEDCKRASMYKNVECVSYMSMEMDKKGLNG